MLAQVAGRCAACVEGPSCSSGPPRSRPGDMDTPDEQDGLRQQPMNYQSLLGRQLEEQNHANVYAGDDCTLQCRRPYVSTDGHPPPQHSATNERPDSRG